MENTFMGVIIKNNEKRSKDYNLSRLPKNISGVSPPNRYINFRNLDLVGTKTKSGKIGKDAGKPVYS
jgi:hypothetical protein